MLAANRTDRVIGRIKLLTNSIKTMRGISPLGVPEGTRWDKNLLRAFTKYVNSINNHTLRAILKVKEILLVGVNVYGVSPKKFTLEVNKIVTKKPKIRYGDALPAKGVINSALRNLNTWFITIEKRDPPIKTSVLIMREQKINLHLRRANQLVLRLKLEEGSKILNKLFIKLDIRFFLY